MSKKLKRQLDAEVAQYVMGEEIFYPDGPSVPWQNTYNKRRTDTTGIEEVPYYSTHLPSAWNVVEKMSEAVFLWQHEEDNSWACRFGYSDAIHSIKTAPLAICIAALSKRGRDVSKYRDLFGTTKDVS